MKETSYSLPPITVRSDKRISGLSAITRGIYRDLLDLMWLRSTQCSLPLHYQTLTDRLNTTERQVKKSIKELTTGEIPLLTIAKGHQGDFILSPMLESQMNGGEAPTVAVFQKKTTLDEEGELQTLKSFDEISKNAFYNNRRYIELYEHILSNMYTNWMPTNRFQINGEAFVITKEILKTLKAHNQHVNIEIVLDKVFNWLMDSGNESKRPRFGNVISLIEKFTKNSSLNVVQKQATESSLPGTLLSDSDFENEMAKLMTTQAQEVH